MTAKNLSEFIDQGYAAHLGPYCLAIYCLLCHRADEQDQCQISKADITADLGISKNPVKRSLQQLEEYRIIQIKRKKHPDDGWLANTYTLIDLSEWVKLPTSARRDHE